jgi:CRISPR-associated protein Csx14
MGSTVLIAMLGSKAQLVTLALDCLHEQETWPDETVVVHTYRGRSETAHALARLENEWKVTPPTMMRYRFFELAGSHGALRDVTAPDELEIAFRTLYKEVSTAKLAETCVHLLIAGGRRTLAVFGMAVAQMLFDDDDRLWHLASHPDLEASGALHAGPGEWARLIPIPVIPWGRLSPVFNILQSVEDPFAAAKQLSNFRMHEQWDSARIFLLTRLSRAEYTVVEKLVREGLNQNEIAESLNLSLRTVEQHLRSAYRKAAEHWELEDVNQTQLVRLLSLYFTASIPENRGKP